MVIDPLSVFLDGIKNKNTRSGYKTDISQFLNFYDAALEKLEYSDIEKYVEHLKHQNLKAQTMNRKLTALKKYLRHLNIGVYDEIECVKVQQKQWLEEAKTITSSEYRRLLNQAEQANDLFAVAVITTLASTGCRVSELISIKGTAYRSGETEIIGKGNKARWLFVSQEAIEAIDLYRKKRGHKDNDFIFINDKNAKPVARQKINEVLSVYGGKARIKKTKTHPHAFRHMVGMTLVESDMPIDRVATILGHNNINTTMIYTKISKTDLKTEMQSKLRKAYG